MHSYPLHRSVAAECTCCRLKQEFVFTSRSDHVICKGCVRHQGGTTLRANQRDADHVALWRSELAVTREDHAEQVARLESLIEQRDQKLAEQRAEIGDLQEVVRAGVERAPLIAVERWWTNEQVSAAEQQRDKAYRSRDYAFRALWAIDRLHHEDETTDGRCTCGKRSDGCKEFGAIASELEALIRWEDSQIDRLERGLPHGLPDDHPEVLKRKGSMNRTGWRTAG